MAITHAVKAKLRDGTELVGWDDYDITIDMLSPGSAWQLSIARSDARAELWDRINAKALCGELLYIAIDEATQLLGYIDRRHEHDSRDQGEILVISGTDVAGPAIKADADPTIQLRGSTLGDAITKIFEPLEIRLNIVDAAFATETTALRHRSQPRTASTSRRRRAHRTSRVDLFKIKPGDKVWAISSQEARRAGYMMWTAPAADVNTVEVVVAAPIEAGDPWVALTRFSNNDGTYGGNILTCDRETDIADVPTEVTAFTHSEMAASQDTRVRAVYTNDRLFSHPKVVAPGDLQARPRYVRSDRARKPAAAMREAERVVADAMADFDVLRIKTQGHGQFVNGELRMFAVNTIVAVSDDRRGINGNWVCTRVHFHQSRGQGQTTELRLVPVGAIKVTPEV